MLYFFEILGPERFQVTFKDYSRLSEMTRFDSSWMALIVFHSNYACTLHHF